MTLEQHLLWIALTWALLLPLALRGLLGAKSGFTRRGWAQIMLLALAFTLTGEVTERHFNRAFGGVPVGLSVKHFAILLAFYLYFLTLQEMSPGLRRYRIVRWIFPLLLGFGLISLPLIARLSGLEQAYARDIAIGVRDLLLLVPTVVVFIPLTWKLHRREQVPGAQAKQLTAMICYVAYALLALDNLRSIGLTLLQPERARIVEAPSPIIVLFLLIFLMLLLPYRGYSVLFTGPRLLLYYRLTRLERHVLDLIAAAPVERPRVFRLLRPAALESAIYQRVINILDYGKLLPTSDTLSDVIRKAAQDAESYEDLLQRLARGYR